MTHRSRFTSSPKSLKQPSLFIRIVNSFLFILLSVGLFQQSFASTFKAFDIEITPPQNYFVARQPVSANVLVRFHVPAQSARILIQGEGVAQQVSQTEEIAGPQSPGYEHTLQLIATPQDLGFGMLTITVEALDTNHQSKVYTRQGKFFLLAEEDFTWVSGSSATS